MGLGRSCLSNLYDAAHQSADHILPFLCAHLEIDAFPLAAHGIHDHTVLLTGLAGGLNIYSADGLTVFRDGLPGQRDERPAHLPASVRRAEQT